MTPLAPHLVTPKGAMVVHRAAVAGEVAVVLALTALQPIANPEPDTDLVLALRIVALGAFVGAIVATRILRTRFEPLPVGGEMVAWWAANFGNAILVWAVAGGAANVGAILWFLTGDWVVLVVAAGGLMLLVWNRPRTLMEG